VRIVKPEANGVASRNMRIPRLFLRGFYSWYFMSLSMIFLAAALWNIRPTTDNQAVGRGPLNPIIRGSVCTALTIVFGIAGLTAFKGRSSQVIRHRGWIVAASLLNTLGSIGVPLLYWHAQGAGAFGYSARLFGFPTLVGIVGLIAFSQPNKWPE
jgi:hypothetical protein